jgi:hypothetical protein
VTALALAALVALGCDGEDRVVGPGSGAPGASAKKPVDRLAPGELAPGRLDAFGLVLPRDLSVDARFHDQVHASGPVTPEALANYVRTRVEVAHVEIGAARTVFPRARIKGAPAERLYRVEVVPSGPRTRLVIRDITPPPTVQGISEEERWRRAGMTPGGELIDPKKQQ